MEKEVKSVEISDEKKNSSEGAGSSAGVEEAKKDSQASKKDENERVSEVKKEENKKNVEEKKSEEKKSEEKKLEEKEDLNDSDIIDLDKESEKKKSVVDKENARGVGGKNAPKSTEDFIAKQKKRKRNKRIVLLIIIIIAIIVAIVVIRSRAKKNRAALEAAQTSSIQTASVVKKKLYDSKDATGTLYALETKTISRILDQTGKSGAEITAVNVGVGDHVEAGDVLVEFSSENIEKSIAETKEDIGVKKQLQAIESEDSQRNYVNSYTSAANNLQDAAEKVDRALEDLHEACDAYGEAKRKRDEAKEKAEDKGDDWDNIKSSYEAAVESAYQKQVAAQRAYDSAVESQARTINTESTNSLSNADSTYKKSQINAGEAVKTLQRTLNNSIDSLDDYVVHATISGVVTEVNVTEGNTFSSGNVLTIQDDSGYKAEVLVDEYDISKVKKAYTEKEANGEHLQVVVKTDATGDKEYKGHVTLIAPTSTSTTTAGASSSGSSSSGASSANAASSSSTANYKISIELDDVDDELMIGMSAKVAIVVNESPDDALCVPYNCIKETDDGKYIVKVMDENGDKNTMTDMMPSPGGNASAPGRRSKDDVSGKSESKGVNGIVIENDTENNSEGDSDNKPNKPGNKSIVAKIVSFITGDTGEVSFTGRRYREVEVEKIFDTDYYVSIVPKTAGSIKEGDEVMIVSDKADGTNVMNMFGGPGGGGPGGGPGGF